MQEENRLHKLSLRRRLVHLKDGGFQDEVIQWRKHFDEADQSLRQQGLLPVAMDWDISPLPADFLRYEEQSEFYLGPVGNKSVLAFFEAAFHPKY
jgi:hypothetical protein